MADFLVSFDGLYINYNNTISQTPEGATVPEQLVNDASLIFDDISGRLVAFKDYIGISKNQDEEDETKSNFYGYMRLSDFFFDRKIKINDGMQWIALGGDASSDPRMYKFSFQPKNVLGESLLTLLKSNVYDVPQARDRIHLVSRVLEKNQNETSIRTKVCSFDWPQRHLMANTETMRSLIDSEGTFESGKKVEEYKFKDGPSIAITHSEIKKYYNSIVNKHKFWTYTGLETRDLTISEANGIEGIVMLWHRIHQHPTFTKNILDNQLGYIFEVHYALINDVDYQTISKAEYLPTFTSDYFLQLRQRLLVFFYNAIRLGENLGKDQVLTYILGLFDTVTLSFLRIEDKLALLNYFITGDFFTGRWNPTLSVYKLTHEEAIVKVVSSIARKDITGTVLNLDEVNRFMYWLCGTPKEQDNKALLLKDKTPYQVLYEGIDDDVFFGDTQKGTLGKFVDAVHALWLVSDFNPDSQDFSLNEGPPVQYRYMTPLADTFYRESLPFDPATSPAPYIIDYNVEKFGPWYFDSFQTNFSGNKIKVLRSKSSTSGGTVGAGVAVLKDDTVTQLFGYYELFQPVSIVNIMANDTIIRMPINVKNMDQIDPNDPCKNAPLIDNSIPIFYLKYIDDKQNISNIKANIEVAVEVALTFSGIGGLTKLRYLRYLALIRPGGLTAVQQLALSRAWSVFFDIIDFGAGIASLTATLSNQCTGNNPCEQQEPSDPNSEEHRRWEACRTVQYWLLGVGLLSVGANVAVARWVRHLSKQVEGFADILALSSAELALVIKMGKVDHVTTVLDDLLLEYNKLRNSLDNISLNTTQRAQFYEDFVLGQNRLPDLELLDQVNLDSAVLNWRNLRGAGYIEEAADLSVIRRQDLVDTFTVFYSDASVRTALYNHTLSKRIAFMDNFKNADQTIIDTFITDSTLVQEWFRYYDETVLRVKFIGLSKAEQIELLDLLKGKTEIVFDFFKTNSRSLDFLFQHTIEAREAIANNIDIFILHRSSYELLKRGKYNEIIAKFGHQLEVSKTVPEFPGVRYISITPDEDLYSVALRAANNNDIIPIANNLGIPEYVSKGAKENYWVKERIVLYEKGEDKYAFGIGRFYKDQEMVDEWNRIVNNDFSQMSKEEAKALIAHEYIEGKLIDLYGMNYTSYNKPNQAQFWSYGAHDISPKASVNQYWTAGRLNENLIPLPNNDLTNLDQIVDQIAKFYILK